MQKLILILIFLFFLAGNVNAQNKPAQPPSPPPPAPVAIPATPQAKPLSMIQMQQLTIVQIQQARAAEELEKLKAQQRALTREFAWSLGVDPEQYEFDLKPLDDQGQQWGFVPKAKPPDKQSKAEPKTDGKGGLIISN